jgi:hypothetical protein
LSPIPSQRCSAWSGKKYHAITIACAVPSEWLSEQDRRQVVSREMGDPVVRVDIAVASVHKFCPVHLHHRTRSQGKAAKDT